ncbi:hypothetical protein [Actinoplanes sp. NPDC051851]|uniref:hypothetical protein n=1 Tax=Actinoplanes sp. NPDC051851 TaxID=3154753 RepID=UPI003447CB91
MTGLDAAQWGLLGSAVAEALNLSASMRPASDTGRWRRPWRNTTERGLVIFAVLLRLFVGCGLAAPMGASGQLPTPFAAFLAGLAAPLIIARLFQSIPLDPAPPPPQPPSLTVTDPPTVLPAVLPAQVEPATVEARSDATT